MLVAVTLTHLFNLFIHLLCTFSICCTLQLCRPIWEKHSRQNFLTNLPSRTQKCLIHCNCPALSELFISSLLFNHHHFHSCLFLEKTVYLSITVHLSVYLSIYLSFYLPSTLLSNITFQMISKSKSSKQFNHFSLNLLSLLDSPQSYFTFICFQLIKNLI